MADAGFKLTVEGEKEFKKAITNINAILKLNQAELQKVVAEYNASDKSVDDMTQKQKELGEVISRQTDAVAQMEDELARLTDSYGENDKGVIKMRTELDKATTTLANMNAQFKANAEELEKASKGAEEYDDVIADIDAQLAAFAAEIKQMDAAMADGNETMRVFGKNAEDIKKQTDALEDQNKLLTSAIEQQEKKLEILNTEMDEAIRKYGSSSREVAEYRTEIAKTTTEIQDMSKKMDENNEKIEKAGDPASGLSDIFGKIAEQTGIEIPAGLDKMISGLGSAAGYAASAAAAFGSVKGMWEMTEDVAMAADEINKFAQQTGLSVEKVQELDYVAKQTNLSFEKLADMLNDVKKNVYDAANGNEELAGIFERLNVDTTNLDYNLEDLYSTIMSLDSKELTEGLKELEARTRGVSKEMISGELIMRKYGDGKQYVENIYRAIEAGEDPTGALAEQFELMAESILDVETTSRDAYDVFLDVIDALRIMENDTDRAAMAEKVLGSSAKELTELFAIGSEGIEQYARQAHELGAVMDEEVINSLDQTAQAIRKLETSLESAKTSAKGLIAGFLSGDWEVVSGSWDNLWQSIGGIFGKSGKSYATGTYNHPGGYALVGERGPEIVDLPAGSRVFPNGQIPDAGSYNVYNITIPASDIREFNDIVRIAQSKRVTERMG